MDAKDVPEIVRAQSGILQFNHEALDIYGSNIKPYVMKLIECQLSAQSAEQAKFRAAPINVLPKIIDKLTNIYQTTVIRNVSTDAESDKNLLAFYELKSRMNVKMNCGNELYNLCNATLLQPYVYRGKPQLRPIPNDKFVVYSENSIEPNIPTHVILTYQRRNGEQYYWVYSDQEIYAVDARGNIDLGVMAASGMVDTLNPVGTMPFIYGNSSEYNLTPSTDEDGLTIVKLIPVMLTDLNLAAMFQCFSILYLINASQEGIRFAPNAVWEINAPPNSDQKPEVGSLKPTVDYAQVMSLITTELSLWLGTKGIRASTVGGLTPENFVSGISKIIDEMDTFEARQKQVTSFQKIESDYWDLIINYMHPYWLRAGMIDQVGEFSTGCEVSTQFAVQLPMQSRGQVVQDLALEVQNGFISRKRAIMKLNPEMSDAEIEALMVEIDEEHTVNGMAADQSGNPQGLEAAAASGAGGSSY